MAEPARRKASKNLPRAVAPYDRSPARAAAHCFDRETGKPVARRQLKTVNQALLLYHLRPDRKVIGGDYRDAGTTHPLHVRAMAIHFIGKEANRWEEQFHLGETPDAQAEYGTMPSDREQLLATVREGIRRHGAQAVAERAHVSRQHVSSIARGASMPSPDVLGALARVVAGLNAEQDREAGAAADVLQAIRQACERHGIRHVARVAGVDDGNLARIIARKRKASPAMVASLIAAVRSLQGNDPAPVKGASRSKVTTTAAAGTVAQLPGVLPGV